MMKFQDLSRFLSCLIIVVFLVVIVVPQASSSRTESYDDCATSFTCGTMSGIQYPFSRHEDPGYCGYPGFDLDCNGKNSPTINMNNMSYHVLSIDHSSQILKIVREDVMDSICPHDFINTTINHNLFDYSTNYMNITFLYGCPGSLNLHGDTFSCDDSGIDKVLVLPGDQGPGICNNSVIVPVPVMAVGSDGLVNSSGLDQVLREGFEVRWKVDTMGCSQCTESNGRCFYNYDTNQTACACPGSPLIADGCTMANTSQASSSPKNRSLTIALPITGGLLATIGIGSGLLFCIHRKKKRATGANETPIKDSLTTVSTNFPANTTTTTEIGNSTYFGTHVFTNAELEAATDGFDDSRELGDGGFGTVYYGKLVDGREVAVKRLYQNSFKRVEQFMNEVEILTMLDHENLVKFYGCTSRRSRELLLVYEYVANGTVADHLHGKLARHDVNLASMAVDRIQNGRLGEFVDKRIGFENDGVVRRVVTLVAELGFRCLQREKDMRPTMREVVECLRGIQNEDLNVQKPEVVDIVDIVVDDGGDPPSSDSGMTGKVVGG
ncbi:hypothetical protein E3N88_12369 [Mikania micrantha]|uniref:non-specific serine/threonine protein kinase n=1 Tax=Mikania micrantha TaxID=192012 RepID=A0A5N6P5B2_9ASTR|nr:hypothetical protein E3N88_12369 [Mikania micrantha]